VDHNNIEEHLTRSDWRVLRSAVYLMQRMRLMLWNGSEEDGDVKSECEEDDGIDCEDGDNDTDR